MKKFNVYANPEAVAQAAADYLFQQITSCVKNKGLCHVVLPGGSTPARCLQLLTKQALPWENIHWYPGDERCYPVGHAERNDTMIYKKLFSQQPNTAKNFHPIAAELGPEQGAEAYATLLAGKNIDIVMLGMGKDGHTASLFPGNIALDDRRRAVAVFNAPKPPLERVSIGLHTLKNADEKLVIATGSNKRDALIKLKEGEPLPVSLLEADFWFVDEEAVNL